MRQLRTHAAEPAGPIKARAGNLTHPAAVPRRTAELSASTRALAMPIVPCRVPFEPPVLPANCALLTVFHGTGTKSWMRGTNSTPGCKHQRNFTYLMQHSPTRNGWQETLADATTR